MHRNIGRCLIKFVLRSGLFACQDVWGTWSASEFVQLVIALLVYHLWQLWILSWLIIISHWLNIVSKHTQFSKWKMMTSPCLRIMISMLMFFLTIFPLTILSRRCCHQLCQTCQNLDFFANKGGVHENVKSYKMLISVTLRKPCFCHQPFSPFWGLEKSHRDDYPIPRKGRPLFFAYKTWSFLPAAGLQNAKTLFY